MFIKISLPSFQLSRHEFKIIAISFLVLAGLGILRSAQNYLKYASTVDYFSVPLTLLFNFIVFSSYVIFTPIIIKMISQFPVGRHHRKSNVLIHIAFSLTFGFLQMILCNLILFGIDLSSAPIFPTFINKYLTGIIQFHLLAYWIILLFVTYKKTVPSKTDDLERFIIKDNKSTTILELEHVYWIEAIDHYQKLHTDSGFFLYKDTMTNLDKKLPNEQFMRIHRSSIVNLSQIKGIKRYNNQLLVKLHNGLEVVVGKSYQKQVRSLFNRIRE